MIKQISIFAENQKGTMLKMTGVLVDANINMYSLITNDSAEFGIVRILTSDSEKAARVLQKAGYLCHLDDVIALEISDAPGSLHHLLRDIHYSNVNIDYLYVTNSSHVETALAVLHTPDITEVELFLKYKGYKVL